MDELWRDIPNYEGIYQASTKGRIRTCEGKTTRTERHGVRHWKQRIIKPKTAKAYRYRDDLRVTLWKDGKRKDYLVARLVAMTWVEGFAPHLTVNHIDGDHKNNNIENLEWLTISENVKHGFENGLYPTKKVKLTNRFTGETTVYRSMAECDRAIGKSHGYISDCFKRNKTQNETYTFELVV